MGESAVKSAAQWLGKLTVEEMNYLGAVTNKVETLKKELNTLAAFLTDSAVRSRRQNNTVRDMLLNAKNIAYDCEDVIERYMLQVARYGYEEYEDCHVGSVVRWGCLLRNAVHVHKIRSKIDELNARIAALKSGLVSYGIVAAETNPSLDERERQFFPHEREVAIGLEGQLKELGDILLDPTDHRVIVVCGMGGIGKSMLARELYHLPTLRGGHGGSFEAFGWAAASQQLQPDQVLRTLLYSLVPANDRARRSTIEDHIKAGMPQEALYNLMGEVKCLVMVDDIWTWNDWASLQHAFPMDGATGSRILLTTRNEDVLSNLDRTQVHLHRIEGLDKGKSWELFEKTAFPGGSCPDSTKKRLGQEMLQHCKGVPLAIVVLAKVLKRKQRVEDWIQLRNDISSQIRRGGAPGLYKEVYDVLQVSYDELPYHLKNCFLHLANFPEDYQIPTEKLYQLWIAEGIVSKEDAYELEEDIAEGYLNELVSRSMVQVSSLVHQRIGTCRMHDFMRDVCMGIAKKEDFLQIINCQGPMLLSNMDTKSRAKNLLMTSLPEIDKGLRRLAVYVTDDQEAQRPSTRPTSTSAKVSRAPNLRSLLFFVGKELEGEEKSKKLVEAISTDFPLLRVLDCKLLLRGKLPKEIGNLVHLRYLGLNDTYVTELPSSIEKMQWLQTIDLMVQSDMVISIPNVLWKLKLLRHIYLPYYGELGISQRERVANAPQRYLIKGGGMLRLGGLTHLQTITHLDLDRVNLQGISELGRMKKVSAVCETNRKALDAFLKLSSVKSFDLRLHAQIINEDPMILSNCESMGTLDLHSWPVRLRLEQSLRLEMLPKSLVRLLIWYLDLVDDPMPVLEKLPILEYLDFHISYDGRRMVCSAGGFPKLTSLVLDGLFNLSDLVVEQGALQQLLFFKTINCQLKEIPPALPSSVSVRVYGEGKPDPLISRN